MARKLIESTRLAVVTMIAAGILTDAEIAQECGTTRQAVHRMRRKLKSIPKSTVHEFSVPAARVRLARKAYLGLESALDDDSDRYKRGGIAVQTLKGLGEFADGQQVNVGMVFQSFATLPPEIAAQYVSLDAIPVEASEEDE